MSLLNRQSCKILFVVSLLLACVSTLQAQTPVPAVPRPAQTVATFKGTPITDEELRKAAAADLDKLSLQMQQMRASFAQTEHKILETNLLRLLADKLFEAEAAKRGITMEALLEKELEGKVKEPTPQDISSFYETNKQLINKPLEQAADQIRQYLKAENRNREIGNFADRLKPEYKVSMLLPPLRSKVETEGSPSKGPKDAPVTLVEFSDFQCPFCMRLSKTLGDVVAKYGDKVRVVYRQFPLSQIHPFAEKAAEASLCAADQNQFWQMHDLMFDTQNLLKNEDLEAKAVKLKLDSAVFDKCLDSGKHAEKVRQDQRDGYVIGVAATPALFVNGRFLSGALPLSDISKVIDEEILYKSARASATAGSAYNSEAQSTAKTP